ncbi:MAG: hypothetical protein ABW212_05290, partial [Pseudonocardia sediminis]
DPSVTDADLVAAVVAGCPSVIALHGGRWGEVATYLPGRQVTGVRLRPNLVEVHVVGRYPVPVPDIARQIRTALRTSPATSVAGTPVEVVVEDYAAPSGP